MIKDIIFEEKNTACSYCKTKGHNIRNCNKDNDLKLLMSKPYKPNFNGMNVNTLRRLCSFYPELKTSKTKKNLIHQLDNKYDEINKIYETHECAICLEPLECNDTCKIKCGHQFHLSCIMKNNKNKCPLCRKEIYEKTNIQQLNNNINPSFIRMLSLPPRSLRMSVPEDDIQQLNEDYIEPLDDDDPFLADMPPLIPVPDDDIQTNIDSTFQPTSQPTVIPQIEPTVIPQIETNDNNIIENIRETILDDEIFRNEINNMMEQFLVNERVFNSILSNINNLNNINYRRS